MKRPKGKKEKGLPGDSLYIYCKYPRVCPVHDTRLIRQLQHLSRKSSRCWRSVDLKTKRKQTKFRTRSKLIREYPNIRDERDYVCRAAGTLSLSPFGTASIGMHQCRDRETYLETISRGSTRESGT